jgi:hypothetical protein
MICVYLRSIVLHEAIAQSCVHATHRASVGGRPTLVLGRLRALAVGIDGGDVGGHHVLAGHLQNVGNGLVRGLGVRVWDRLALSLCQLRHQEYHLRSALLQVLGVLGGLNACNAYSGVLLLLSMCARRLLVVAWSEECALGRGVSLGAAVGVSRPPRLLALWTVDGRCEWRGHYHYVYDVSVECKQERMSRSQKCTQVEAVGEQGYYGIYEVEVPANYQQRADRDTAR